jgi:hypothetical protein
MNHLIHQFGNSNVLGIKLTGNFSAVDHHHAVSDIIDMEDVVIDEYG